MFELNMGRIIVIAWVWFMIPSIGIYITAVFPPASGASYVVMDKFIKGVFPSSLKGSIL